jgi:hypothetical protein
MPLRSAIRCIVSAIASHRSCGTGKTDTQDLGIRNTASTAEILVPQHIGQTAHRDLM